MSPSITDNITQDVVRVSDHHNHLYTINMYRTKSSAMINGPNFTTFLDKDFPVISRQIDSLASEISENNAYIKNQLQFCELVTNNPSTSPAPTTKSSTTTPSPTTKSPIIKLRRRNRRKSTLSPRKEYLTRRRIGTQLLQSMRSCQVGLNSVHFKTLKTAKIVLTVSK